MVVNASEALRARLEGDVHADVSSLRTDTDRTMSIGSNVWRLRWRNQLTTAVAADANLATTCGALLDALALHEAATSQPSLLGDGDTLDLSTVNVLVDRALPGDTPTEVDQALRTVRAVTSGVHVRVWYRRGDTDWADDVGPAPTWHGHSVVTNWVDHYLLPRLRATPTGLARQIVDAVDDPSLHLYPSPIDHDTPDRWALRIDGLQIGIATAQSATLTIGKPGKGGDGAQRTTFIEEAGAPSVTVVADQPGLGELSSAEAAVLIRRLLRRFRTVDVPGAPLTHRAAKGVPIVDEHTLEARLLKGLTRLDYDQQLVLDDHVVARGSQFPTLWTDQPGGRAKYLDAMVRRDATPIAIELKVATGGQGRYYRRSLVQAVLYRHFITNAPGLDPWFQAAGLDQTALEAAIGIPTPARWTNRFDRDLDLLRSVAARVGVHVYVLDDRATPEHATDEHPEPERHEYEPLTWRLVSELMRRWPTSLGLAYETHTGGIYDTIELHHTRATPHGTNLAPRIDLNRPGSLHVFPPQQNGMPERWVWRGIWNYLAASGEVADAAEKIGVMAGLPDEKVTEVTLASVAAAFLDGARDGDWQWRCAWADGYVPAWIDRYRTLLARYTNDTNSSGPPWLSHIWGAVKDGQAALIVDQTALRAWAWTDAGPVRLQQGGLLEDVRRAAEQLSGLASTTAATNPEGHSA